MDDGPAVRDTPAAPLRAAAPGPRVRITMTEPGVELAIVVPTLEERENIAPLIARLTAALEGIAWEVVFVDDDSSDGTAAVVRASARADRRVRIVQRLGRRGLSSACVEGILSCSAPFVAVMDADLQHDERLLPRMLARLKAEELDLVIGSRYAVGGSTGAWSPRRLLLSRLGSRGAQWLLQQQGELRDPLSGFFMLRREVFEACVRRLSLQGFKVLLDILASTSQPLRFAEIPYRFAPREHGSSKLDAAVTWQFGLLILEKLAGPLVPARFVLFAAVGASGVLVQLVALATLRHALTFAAAQGCAVWLAMTSNYLLNNAFTYRDRRLRGLRFWRGLATFYLICGIGALANVGVGTLLYVRGEIWWLAGLASAIVGAAWNYGATRFFTWSVVRR
jgi:dolichol-phosphate mannosyltransferase